MLVLVLLNSAGIVRAKEPYVYAYIPQSKVNLGTISIWDSVIPEAMTLKINSNCLHGPVVASISSLKNSLGNEITSDRIFIKTPFTDGFVSMAKPVAISKPAIGSHDIVIDFKVKAIEFNEPAGKYSGTLVFTVMAAF